MSTRKLVLLMIWVVAQRRGAGGGWRIHVGMRAVCDVLAVRSKCGGGSTLAFMPPPSPPRTLMAPPRLTAAYVLATWGSAMAGAHSPRHSCRDTRAVRRAACPSVACPSAACPSPRAPPNCS